MDRHPKCDRLTFLETIFPGGIAVISFIHPDGRAEIVDAEAMTWGLG
jgi:hypothetical protein